MVKAVLSLDMKKESITAYCRQKYSSGMASTILSWEEG
jgi:hypothetical protein